MFVGKTLWYLNTINEDLFCMSAHLRSVREGGRPKTKGRARENKDKERRSWDCGIGSETVFGVQCVCVCTLRPVRLFVTPWTVACQAPPSMEFSRQEYRIGFHFFLQGIFPHAGIEPRSPALQADSLPSCVLFTPRVEFTPVLCLFPRSFPFSLFFSVS